MWFVKITGDNRLGTETPGIKLRLRAIQMKFDPGR